MRNNKYMGHLSQCQSISNNGSQIGKEPPTGCLICLIFFSLDNNNNNSNNSNNNIFFYHFHCFIINCLWPSVSNTFELSVKLPCVTFTKHSNSNIDIYSIQYIQQQPQPQQQQQPQISPLLYADVRQSPFALDLQPPLLEAATDEAFAKSKDRTVDSYGNPIDALRPIDTPDGRKVVSAQGVQFEIPNYASGITEIRQPADDLLPPHIGELTTTTTTTRTTTRTTRTTTTATATTNGASASRAGNNNQQTKKQPLNTQIPATIASGLVAPPTQPPQPPNTNSLSFATTPTRTHNHIHSPVEPLTTTTTNTTTPAPAPAPVSLSNHFKRDSRSQQFVITAADPKHAPPTFTLLTLNPQPPQSQLDPPAPPESSSKRIDSIDATTYSNATPTPSQLLVDAIAVAQSSTSDTDTDSTSFAPAPQPATSLTPPKHESSTSTTSTEVEVEQAQLQEHQEQREESAHAPQLASGTLPDYLLELQRQDALIDGPVPWIPAPHGTPLSVIAWDLLPPLESEPQKEPLIITEQQPTKHVVGVEQPGNHNIRITLGSGQGLSPVAPTVGHVTSGQVAVVPLERDGPEAHGTNAHVGGGSTTTPRNNIGRFPSRHRGTVHYSTTTSTQRPRSSTTSTTTATRPPLTTRATVPTTTTRTTTPRTTKPSTTTVRSTTPLDPSTFYKLDNEEEYAYTLPPWLQEVTDPDLDVAVTFIVPTDNDQYNHTLNEDLEPPFEPFVDLHNIQLTPPPTARPTTTSTTSTTSTTTTTTTTTRRPSSTTSTTKAPIFKAQQLQQQQQPLKPLQPQLITTTTHTAPAAHHQGSTTTTATPSVDPNPFDSATVPPWLQDFDYPDVGPGVPYNPDNFKDDSPVSSGGGSASGGSKPNDFQPQGFGSRHSNSQSTTTTTTTTTNLNPITTITTSSPATITASSASAFPSKVTLPLPAINNGAAPELSTEEPPLVLIPPVDESAAPLGSSSSFDSSLPPPAFGLDPNPNLNPTTNSISHFAAPFDSPSSTIAGQASTSSPTEQFPLSATDNQKVEYTKSDEGKVISTPVNTLRKDSQPSVAPQTPTRSPVSNTGKYTGGFGGPAGLLRPQQSVAKPDIYVAGNDQEFSHTVKANRQRPGAAPAANTGRYTGGFGAPSGVLSPQNAPRPFQQSQSQPQPQESRAHPSQVAGAVSSHHQNRFGGPPGILVPFDNVQRTAQQ